MTLGRTMLRFGRIYINGRDLSGYTRSYGPLATVFEEGMDDAITKNVKGAMLGSANISMGTLNGLFDNTATIGIHAVLGTAGLQRTVMIAQGIQAAPVAGDPVFAGQFQQLGYSGKPDDNPVTASVPFGNTSTIADNLAYAQPWGTLLHANGAETGVNSANGYGGGGQTTKGGFMVYHVLAAAGSGNITATFKTQNSATAGGAYTDLLSTGVINCGSGGVYVPVYGIVALANPATVESYTRWQVVFGTATSVTFVLSFHRNYI
jgi:hypothetical protein